MNALEYQEKAKSLRHHPMVEAWIKEYKKTERHRYADCRWCSFPHQGELLCNEAQFGSIIFGGHGYSVSLSNVVWWVGFMAEYAPKGAFHWKNERFFQRTDDGIVITSFDKYNNTPQKRAWLIPGDEWDSIIKAVAKCL